MLLFVEVHLPLTKMVFKYVHHVFIYLFERRRAEKCFIYTTAMVGGKYVSKH